MSALTTKPAHEPRGTEFTKDRTRFGQTVILGPTTVGKTEVAFGLARRLGAEVINADKFYLYGAMPHVTGQSDAHLYPDVPSHLYGVLKPNEPRWSESRYYAEVKACLRETRLRRHPVIVEGCSYGLIRAAVAAVEAGAEATGGAPLLIGLRWPSGTDVSASCERRAKGMMAHGMAPEFQRALTAGYGESYVVRKCFARSPLQAYLRGENGRSTCCSQVAEELERHAQRHDNQLHRIPGVVWIEHDCRSPEVTINRILDLQTAQAEGNDVMVSAVSKSRFTPDARSTCSLSN